MCSNINKAPKFKGGEKKLAWLSIEKFMETDSIFEDYKIQNKIIERMFKQVALESLL